MIRGFVCIREFVLSRERKTQCGANDRSTCMPYPRRQRSSWTRIKSSILVSQIILELPRMLLEYDLRIRDTFAFIRERFEKHFGIGTTIKFLFYVLMKLSMSSHGGDYLHCK